MTQNEDVTKLAQADHSQQAASADLPTEAQIREFGTFHYSRAVSDEVYFRTKFRALRECLAHAFPDGPLGSMKFGAENTPVAKLLDEFAEHLLRASRNPMYGDNGAFTDLLFEWEETVPLICRYLARRGTPIEALRNLTIEDTRQIEGLRDVFLALLDSDNGNESGANIVVNVIKANTRIAEIHEQHDEFIESKLDDLEAKVGKVGRGVKAAAAEGARKAVEKTLPLVYAKTANMSDEELENATKPKTRSSGGGRHGCAVGGVGWWMRRGWRGGVPCGAAGGWGGTVGGARNEANSIDGYRAGIRARVYTMSNPRRQLPPGWGAAFTLVLLGFPRKSCLIRVYTFV